MDLFRENSGTVKNNRPLSARFLPGSIGDIAGQEHLVGEGRLLRRAIEADRISSVIFYGPPGTGKTALALVISRKTGAIFIRKNAVSSNVAEIRKIIDSAKKARKMCGQGTIILLDEIHRFNKAQQDVLLPEVEEGTLILIGTTTENPFFSVNAALLSRSQVFEFKPLSPEDVHSVLKKALSDEEKGLGGMDIRAGEDALEHLSRLSGGDARKALNALELAVLTTGPDADGTIGITLEAAEQSIQKKAVVYDRDGDAHYDTASAYIKSMRGSDPDAALYWLAKMITAGEDPRFITRRLVICASEDVGNADPRALLLAEAAARAAEFIGFPEARIPIAQATIYVACAPKSNASYNAIERAMGCVREDKDRPVPDSLRDSHYKGAKELGRGKGYKYAHGYKEHYVEQEYMPGKKTFYEPGQLGYERKIAEWMAHLRDTGNGGGRGRRSPEK
jgi:putative ATPase